MGAQLQHENLVRIYDFGESTGRYYLAMEYIEGQTIATAIADRGPMPPATAVRLVRQVADGLDHIHRKGLVHRDVNPFNILVTHEGIAKLADLGLAIAVAEDDRITRDGATIGTFDYIAPEQARDSRAADARSDIYSLGCTLYHMCSGQVPFPGPSLPEKLLGHQALEPAPLCRMVPGIPEGLGEIVRRMMKKVPAERYATPMEVALALGPYEVDHVGAPVRAAAAPAAPASYASVAANPGFRPYDDDPAAPLLTPDEFDETTDQVRLILDPDPEPPSGGIHALPVTRSFNGRSGARRRRRGAGRMVDSLAALGTRRAGGGGDGPDRDPGDGDLIGWRRGASIDAARSNLYCDWLRQYATETTLHRASLYPEVAGRVGRLDGYLLGTSLTVLAWRKPDDWSARPDAWGSLGLLLARYESEFTGAWSAIPGTWSAGGRRPPMGSAGACSASPGSTSWSGTPTTWTACRPSSARGRHLPADRLQRGGPRRIVGPGDERGLTDLGRAFLDRLSDLTPAGKSGPRPILDLAGMNAATVADTIRWLDQDRPGSRSWQLAISHGTTHYHDLQDGSSPDLHNLGAVRSRGGVIGLTPGLPGCESAEELKALVDRVASIPFEGRSGLEGIGIGSNLLGLDRPAPGFGSARDIARALERLFGRETAANLIAGNARQALLGSAGVSPLLSPPAS